MGSVVARANPETRHAPRWVRRPRLDGPRVIAAAFVIAVTAALALEPPPGWEVSFFRAFNTLPRYLDSPLWLLQQAGMLMAVPAAAVALRFVVGHWRLPVGLIAGGIILGWAAAKGIKTIVDRGRPGALLDDVMYGLDGAPHGLGFPSGHAVVVFTIAVVSSPYLPRWLRWLVYGLAVVVCVARLFVGAHMPLDVIGGAAFGLIVGSLVNLAVGIDNNNAQPEAIPQWSLGQRSGGAAAR